MASKEEIQRQILSLVESEENFHTYYDQIEESILQKDKTLIKVLVAVAAQVLDQNKKEPIQQFLLMLLIQKVVVKKSIETINEVHNSSTMLKALEKIAKHAKDSPNPNRGSSYFPNDPEIGSKFLILILEFILKSAASFSQDANKNPTKFAQLYGRLLDEGVTFPQEPLTFYEAKKKKKNQQSQQSVTAASAAPSGRGGNDKPPSDTQTQGGPQKSTKNNANMAMKIFDDVEVTISTLINIFTVQDEVDQDTKDEIESQSKRFQKHLNQLTQMLSGDGEYDEEIFSKMFTFQEFLTDFNEQVQIIQQSKYEDSAMMRFKHWLLSCELPFQMEQEPQGDHNDGMQQHYEAQQQQQSQFQQQQQQPQPDPKSKMSQQDSKQRDFGDNKFDSVHQQQPQQQQQYNDHFDFNQFGSQSQQPNQNQQNNNEDLFGTFTNNQMKDLQNKNQNQPSNFDNFEQFGSQFQNQNKQQDDLAQMQSKLQQEELDKQYQKQKELEKQIQLEKEQEDERKRQQLLDQQRKEQDERLKKQKEEEEKQAREKERIRREQEDEKERQRQRQIQEEEQDRLLKLQKQYELEEENKQKLLRQQQQSQRDELDRQRRQREEQQQMEEDRLYREQEDKKNQDTQNDSFNQKSNFYYNANEQINRDSFGGGQNQGYFFNSNINQSQANNNNNNNNTPTPSNPNNNNYNISVNNQNSNINSNYNSRPPAGPSQGQVKQNQDPKLSKIESAFGNPVQKFSFGPDAKNNQGSQVNQQSQLNLPQNEDNRTEMSFNEQFSVSNISMAGGYSQHDFPMKHIKLIDNKTYKGQEVPVLNTIDQTLKQYQYSAHNIRRYRLSNLKRKNNLFENSQIQIGCISDLIFDYINSQNYLKLTVFLGNKSRQPIRNIKIEFDGDESSYVYLKQDKVIDFIAAKTQEKFEIIIGYKDIPFSLVNMDVTADFGEIEDFQTVETSIFLPNLLPKYIQFKDLDASAFHQKWKDLRSQILKTDIFAISKQIIKTPAYFRRYFTKVLEITSLEQFVLQQNSNQYDIKYYKLGALIELADSESEFLIKFNIRPDNTLCIQIISLNEAYQSTAAFLLQHLRYLLQA